MALPNILDRVHPKHVTLNALELGKSMVGSAFEKEFPGITQLFAGSGGLNLGNKTSQSKAGGGGGNSASIVSAINANKKVLAGIAVSNQKIYDTVFNVNKSIGITNSTLAGISKTLTNMMTFHKTVLKDIAKTVDKTLDFQKKTQAKNSKEYFAKMTKSLSKLELQGKDNGKLFKSIDKTLDEIASNVKAILKAMNSAAKPATKSSTSSTKKKSASSSKSRKSSSSSASGQTGYSSGAQSGGYTHVYPSPEELYDGPAIFMAKVMDFLNALHKMIYGMYDLQLETNKLFLADMRSNQTTFATMLEYAKSESTAQVKTEQLLLADSQNKALQKRSDIANSEGAQFKSAEDLQFANQKKLAHDDVIEGEFSRVHDHKTLEPPKKQEKGGMFSKIFKSIKGFMNPVMEFIEGLLDLFAISKLMKMAKTFLKIGSGVKKVAAIVEEGGIGEALAGLGEAFMGFLAPILAFVALIGAAYELFAGIKYAYNKHQKEGGGVWEFIKNVGIGAFKDTKGNISNLSTMVTGKASDSRYMFDGSSVNGSGTKIQPSTMSDDNSRATRLLIQQQMLNNNKNSPGTSSTPTNNIVAPVTNNVKTNNIVSTNTNTRNPSAPLLIATTVFG